MPIDEGEWDSIVEAARREARAEVRKLDRFVISRVVKVDEGNSYIYIDGEDNPVPLFGFEIEALYYDRFSDGLATPASTPSTLPGGVDKKKAKVRVIPPQVGDYVLILVEMGRIPRCIGKLLSTGFGDTVDFSGPNPEGEEE